MNKRNILYAVMTAAALLLSSCAGFQAGRFSDAGLERADQLNRGMDDTLAVESLYPFVMETEILASESQIFSFWQGLVSAGYGIQEPAVTLNRPVLPEDSALFADSWEMEVFFAQRLEKDDRLILVSGLDTSFYLILRPTDDRGTRILGWKEAAE